MMMTTWTSGWERNGSTVVPVAFPSLYHFHRPHSKPQYHITLALCHPIPIILLSWANVFGPLISDSIVVWRAFILLQHRRWLTTFPLLLLLGSIVMSAGNAILASLTMTGNFWRGLINTFYVAGLGLSLATNVVATALIGYVYWLHRKDTVALSSRPTRGVRVLAIIIESGVVFCVPQLPRPFTLYYSSFLKVLGAPGSAGEKIRYAYASAYFACALMYPTVVIVLVNRHYTMDQYLSDPSLPPIHHISGTSHIGELQPMSFALLEPAASTGAVTENIEKKSILE